LDELIEDRSEEGLVSLFKSVKSVPKLLRFICNILISKRDMCMIQEGNSLIGLELGIVKGIIDETLKGKNERESEEFFQKILDKFTKR